jgi:hypothetical protein
MKVISVYVPMGLEKSEYWLNIVERSMVTWFGGATTSDAHGLYLNASQVVVHDTITIVTSFEPKPGMIDAKIESLRGMLACIKHALHQESVVFTIQEGNALFV